MSKAFTKETDHDDDDDDVMPSMPTGVKNYITPQGYARLRGELMQLIDDERPRTVETRAVASGNGLPSASRTVPVTLPGAGGTG